MIPNEASSLLGPPLPARNTSKVASGLLLGCSWAAPGCSWAAPGLLSQKHEQPATTNNLRQFGLLRWGVRVVVSTRRSERWVRLHTIASISSRDLVLGVSAYTHTHTHTHAHTHTHRHISIRTSRLEDRRAGRCILRRRDSRCVVSERHRAGVLGLGCPMHGELARPASPHEVGEGALTAVCPPAGPNLPSSPIE